MLRALQPLAWAGSSTRNALWSIPVNANPAISNAQAYGHLPLIPASTTSGGTQKVLVTGPWVTQLVSRSLD